MDRASEKARIITQLARYLRASADPRGTLDRLANGQSYPMERRKVRAFTMDCVGRKPKMSEIADAARYILDRWNRPICVSHNGEVTVRTFAGWILHGTFWDVDFAAEAIASGEAVGCVGWTADAWPDLPPGFASCARCGLVGRLAECGPSLGEKAVAWDRKHRKGLTAIPWPTIHDTSYGCLCGPCKGD